MLSLKSPIGTNYRVDANDLMDTKRALSDLGYYDVPPHRGIDDWTDDATFNGIKRFQQDNGLKVDGFMRPGGPTEGAINQNLARASFAGGGHYNPDQPRDWHGRWTYAGGGNGKAVDLDKLADTATKRAGNMSQHKCAKFVREALEAAGADTSGHPVSAKDYGPTLEKNGFKPVGKEGYEPKKGDIVVIQPVPGAERQDGHIAVYNGKQWVSDYKQPGFWPGHTYRAAKPTYTVYRHGA